MYSLKLVKCAKGVFTINFILISTNCSLRFHVISLRLWHKVLFCCNNLEVRWWKTLDICVSKGAMLTNLSLVFICIDYGKCIKARKIFPAPWCLWCRKKFPCFYTFCLKVRKWRTNIDYSDSFLVSNHIRHTSVLNFRPTSVQHLQIWYSFQNRNYWLYRLCEREHPVHIIQRLCSKNLQGI